MSNPLLNASEQAHTEALRSNGAAALDSTVSNWMEIAPGMFPSLANIAQNPWHVIVFMIALATSGGALVGGVLIPVAYEVVQGKIDALPYAFWGVSLWLACAGWFASKRWLPFLWFVGILLIISSWV